MASLTEGLATTLECFKDLALLRDPGLKAQKFCILVCNSAPYNLPVMDLPSFRGLTLEQLAVLVNENNIQLSIISPRRIPTWVTPAMFFQVVSLLICEMYADKFI